MTLAMVDRPARVRVVGILGGPGVHHRLAQLGVYPGAVLLVAGPRRRGPVLVEVYGSRIALGRGIAHKILVELL